MVRRTLISVCTSFALLLLATGAGKAQTTSTTETKKTTTSTTTVKPAAAQCGGIAGLKCPDGQACKYPVGKCNVADLSGTCVRVAAVCPPVVAPVCGCDGKTYPNPCELLKSGVHEEKRGKCDAYTGGGTGTAVGAACTTNADCTGTNQFCQDKAGVCKPPGQCAVKPEICPDIVKPVCGCDGKTYSNDCLRQRAGVSLKSQGACK
jgi:hypothetical protein